MGRLKRVGLLVLLSLGAQAAEAPEGDAFGPADYAPPATRSLDYPVFPPRPASAEPAEYAGMIATHNAWRAKVGARAIEGWSTEAAAMAQAWAEQLATEDCQMRHNLAPERKKVFGENIYRYWRSSPYEGYRRDAAYVVDAWGSEIEWYDAERNTCQPPEGGTCGHYTQLVWSGSTLLGCGRAHCGTSEVWVCNYYPRGNYVGLRPFAPPSSMLADAPPAAPAPASVPAAAPAVSLEPRNAFVRVAPPVAPSVSDAAAVAATADDAPSAVTAEVAPAPEAVAEAPGGPAPGADAPPDAATAPPALATVSAALPGEAPAATAPDAVPAIAAEPADRDAIADDALEPAAPGPAQEFFADPSAPAPATTDYFGPTPAGDSAAGTAP